MIQIRALQHYLYCPHRWGLLYIEDAWQENAFTVKADLVHKRVDGGGVLKSGGGVRAYGDVAVYDEELGIQGKVDCLEVSEEGELVNADIVEYKPTMPKSGMPADAERLQIYAQYLCGKKLFSGTVRAFVYYADVHRRVRVKFDEHDDEMLRDTIAKIKAALEQGVVPPIEKSEKCNGCSLADRCMPGVCVSEVKRRILEDMS